VRYLFMNTIQTYNIVSQAGKVGGSDVASNAGNSQAVAQESTIANADRVSMSAASDAVVARVISSSIDKSFNRSADIGEIGSSASNKLMQRFSAQTQSDNILPDIGSVTANVVGFVGSALANLAKRGFDEDQLRFFKNEAITGVEVGIDFAKLDLVGIANVDIFKTIDATKKSILGGIHELPTAPDEYKRHSTVTDQSPRQELTSIEVRNSARELVNVDFETRAFAASSSDMLKSIYTTSSSNISFSLQGNVNESSQQNIANLLNKVDGLANSFYRGEVEAAYLKSMELGYNDNEMLGLAKQLNISDKFQQIKVYEDIQHLESVRDKSDFAAPKKVADYINRYLDVMESSKSILSTEDDFNQVINGLVTQMKDVQVPDLLQAINRFYAFNNKFVQ
jgi:hypothetical protein